MEPERIKLSKNWEKKGERCNLQCTFIFNQCELQIPQKVL